MMLELPEMLFSSSFCMNQETIKLTSENVLQQQDLTKKMRPWVTSNNYMSCLWRIIELALLSCELQRDDVKRPLLLLFKFLLNHYLAESADLLWLQKHFTTVRCCIKGLSVLWFVPVVFFRECAWIWFWSCFSFCQTLISAAH